MKKQPLILGSAVQTGLAEAVARMCSLKKVFLKILQN